MQPLALIRYSLVSALGRGATQTYHALRQRRGGLRQCDFPHVDFETCTGTVDGLERAPVINALADFDCRNNRLAQLALQQDDFAGAVAEARGRYGAHRVAVVLGTSTSGILETERAYRERDPQGNVLPSWFRYRHTHDTFSVADFTRRYLGLSGPALSVSTACSSSAKVFASAARLIEAGACDAAVVGGADSLCLTTLYGFASLELVSRRQCRPCDAQRDGLSIGEAAGFALLERSDAARGRDGVALLGYGESSDAYHMSTPHPQGAGAALAMRRALASAGLQPADIDYINLHGTATRMNDSVEDRAVAQVFGTATPCSSTKGWTGHTLGAAGIVEAIIACLCIEHGFMPGSLNTRELDPAFSSRVLLGNRDQPVRRVLSNSFGFGGSNCSLVLGVPA
ncbi:MAG: beta-ketoacyl-[acyl-carrier-protein] synthase family protein [Gammaproteobacteria bacterium]|nr:beta-ketoacyl-[acyl-carrier-protein] synthase family protein [Gammaproteobacteria bacterium]